MQPPHGESFTLLHANPALLGGINPLGPFAHNMMSGAYDGGRAGSLAGNMIMGGGAVANGMMSVTGPNAAGQFSFGPQ